MIKVHILTVCEFCDGQAYQPVGPEIDANGDPYTRYRLCTYCKGSGNREKWVALDAFVEMLTAVALSDPMEPDWSKLAQEKVTSQYQDSRDAAGM